MKASRWHNLIQGGRPAGRLVSAGPVNLPVRQRHDDHRRTERGEEWKEEVRTRPFGGTAGLGAGLGGVRPRPDPAMDDPAMNRENWGSPPVNGSIASYLSCSPARLCRVQVA